MNTYAKWCPAAWVICCEQEYKHGEEVPVVNKYGQEKMVTVWKMVKAVGGKFYHSFLRHEDAYAARKLARYEGAAINAAKVANAAWAASNEGADFLALAEPIKIGHHSERRHRALIERNHRRMGKSVEYSQKADAYQAKADYWREKLGEITLAMPASVEHYAQLLEKAKAHHAGLKSGDIPKRHSFSLQYANKEVKDLTTKLKQAKTLWEI